MEAAGERWCVARPWRWYGRSDWFRRQAAAASCSVALESGPGYGELGRWSLFAWDPQAVFTVRGPEWSFKKSDGWPVLEAPPRDLAPLEAFRALVRQTRYTPFSDESGLPFRGGWIGFIGYDFAPQLERLSRRHRPTLLPDMQWMYFSFAHLTDRRRGVHYLATHGWFDDALWPKRLAEMQHKGPILTGPDSSAGLPPPALGPPTSVWTNDEYLRAVRRTIEYIKAGDIFQANLTHRFTSPLHAIWRDPQRMGDLWERCVSLSAAPFSALIKTPDWSILSTSPERFLLVEPDGRVETRPIKGTRPRGKSAKEDLAQMTELLSSAKDRAELAMIVDLERNDLGRVCEFGSVKVAQHAALESYSNVHHLVSVVEGKLKGGCDVIDLLAATFPGGSITGAPKIRAMEIIDELEACSRGVYTGAIGYISDHGRADFNIAIRTLVVEGDTAHFHVGGGITADSDPEAEYEETLAKGSKLTQVLCGDA